MVRGIDRRKIYLYDSDRDGFLKRLGGILRESQTPCFAWALMANHFHLPLPTKSIAIPRMGFEPKFRGKIDYC
jgi:hypothetical protein